MTAELPEKLEDFMDKPCRAEAENAYRTIIRYLGDDPSRAGLKETPARAVRALNEYFGGYEIDPAEILHKTFEEIDGYNEMIILREIPFESHCEHHLAPIIGKAWIAYLPVKRVVGISKLARVVDAYAKRLQIQERMTAQIAKTIEMALHPAGVGVAIKATHHCMSSRGVKKHNTDMITRHMLGDFSNNDTIRSEFLSLVS